MSSTQTATHQANSINSITLKGTADELPQNVLERIDALPKLSLEQAGHLRHFHNPASQLDGDWSYFGCQEPGQEWLDAIRYQLDTMAYATGAAHFHRLPALRAPMRELI